MIFQDEISIVGINCDIEKYSIVETFEADEGASNSFILTSKDGIYNLTLYRLQWDYNNGRIKKRERITTYPFLNVGHSVEVRLIIPEVFITYEIKYYTPDYRKVKIPLAENLKSGVESEFVKPKHTCRSILYHLFK